MSEKKKELSIEARVMALEKTVSDIAAWRRKASANWKNFCAKFVGASATDGKLDDTRDGRAGVWAMVGVFCMAAVVSVIVAIAGPSDLGSAQTDIQNYGKFRIDANGSTSMSSNLTVWGQALLYGRTVISNGTIATTDVVVANSITAGGIISSPAVSNAVGKIYGSNLIVKAGGTITVPDNSIASEAIAGGLSWTITNAGTGYTNLWVFTNGLLESYTATGTMP